MEKILKNKKILISGIGKGLGLDMFYKCIDSGAFIYGFTRSKDDIKKIKKEYLKKSKIFVGNASDYKFLKKLFFYFKKNKIYLNGLINNAGQRQRKSFIDITKKDINDIINVNFYQYFISQFLYFVGTQLLMWFYHENLFRIGYASSKSAISGFTKSLALELAEKKFNIRVNCINPGFIKTSYYKKFKKNKKLYSWTLSKISARRWGQSPEIAKLAIFLLSNKASYINGQIINIDGGWK